MAPIYNKTVLKSDNEPAIVKLLAETLRELRIQGLEQCLEEHPREHDPQSNGSAEVGVKLLKGHVRTLRSCMESKNRLQDSGEAPADIVDGEACRKLGHLVLGGA